MDADDQLTSDILAALSCLPFEKQAEGMRNAISDAIKLMSEFRLREIRDRIGLELDDSVASIRMTLEMIDGQIALREIAGGAYWR